MRAGSGIDQCSRPTTGSASWRAAASSSWAASQTVMTSRPRPSSGFEDVVDVPRRGGGQRNAVAMCGGDRAGMHGRRGVGARRGRRDRARVVPQRGGELGARGVVGADEHDPDRVVHLHRAQRVERAGCEREVGAAAVGLGAVPSHAPRPSPATRTWWASRFDGMSSSCCSSVGDASPSSERVDDRQPPGVAQGGVHGSTTPPLRCSTQRSLRQSSLTVWLRSSVEEVRQPQRVGGPCRVYEAVELDYPLRPCAPSGPTSWP